ncbi:hypothetical protein PIROE2DRAFT_12899 [Piromyces sp. E2]|nr:hypothetical protein PIROE2DRAFT_12899 [Piromyces sp. E2]|eukprot:OUM61180.1 hypothetical protein PIROE2DRAFT_12899 [Piromyces sp. E2]
MKFYIPFISLLTVTTAFSYTLLGRNIKRDVTLNVNKYAFSEVSENCKNDLIEFQDLYKCTGFVNITKENLHSVCVDFNSEKCQTVLQDPLSYIPNCKNSIVISELFSETAVNFKKAEMKIVCTFDESGNLCPVGEIFVNKTSNQIVERSAIRQSCRSEKCTKVMIDSLPLFLKETKNAEGLTITEGKVDKDIDKNVDEWVDYLKSEECSSQYIKNGQNVNSASISTVKVVNSALIITIALIVFYFLN